MHCPSCGGVIGRDCFNPSECAMIEHQMESDQRYQQAEHIHHLERENREMREEINQLKAAIAALSNPT